MSELKDEGVRAILRRLDAIEKRMDHQEACMTVIQDGHVQWTYTSESGGLERKHLAGQDFINEIRDIRVVLRDVQAESKKAWELTTATRRDLNDGSWPAQGKR